MQGQRHPDDCRVVDAPFIWVKVERDHNVVSIAAGRTGVLVNVGGCGGREGPCLSDAATRPCHDLGGARGIFDAVHCGIYRSGMAGAGEDQFVNVIDNDIIQHGAFTTGLNPDSKARPPHPARVRVDHRDFGIRLRVVLGDGDFTSRVDLDKAVSRLNGISAICRFGEDARGVDSLCSLSLCIDHIWQRCAGGWVRVSDSVGRTVLCRVAAVNGRCRGIDDREVVVGNRCVGGRIGPADSPVTVVPLPGHRGWLRPAPAACRGRQLHPDLRDKPIVNVERRSGYGNRVSA